jgi:hypothetical protein
MHRNAANQEMGRPLDANILTDVINRRMWSVSISRWRVL